MRRIRRKARLRGSGLTLTQEGELTFGLTIGKDGFESRPAMEKSWWKHRDRLMAACDPLRRPFGFWAFEVHSFPQRREREQDALLRFGLELTASERQILIVEPARWIPKIVPPAAVEHWEHVVDSLVTRRDWHEREGRKEQARAWGEQAKILRARIERARKG